MHRLPLLALLVVAQAASCEQIGDIEFFGYKGIDVTRLRAGLPVREGDPYTEQTRSSIREAVAASIGKQPTDVAAICCDEKGHRLLFIGLPGESSKSFEYLPAPKGNARLPASIIDLDRRLDSALESAVRKGGDGIREDDSQGYALSYDPAAKALQLELRRWALEHEREIIRALEQSSDAAHRRVAATALGYARQSRRQIIALARAARDSDEEVRNNATRALSVLVRSKAKLAAQIPPDTFIELLSSGAWTDRNKAAALLAGMTAARDPALLAKIRSTSLDALIEMARWRRPGHAFFARVIAGRIAGLPEERLKDLAWKGPVDDIVNAALQR